VIVAGEDPPASYVSVVDALGAWGVLRFAYGSTDAERRATLPMLPAGEYVVQVGEGFMTLRVPAAGVVRFVPDSHNALRVVVADPEGAFARAGLATGDVVLGANGKTFRELRRGGDLVGTLHWQWRLAHTTFALMVQRTSGLVEEVPVDFSTLHGSEKASGGRFEPITR
jgi:hypothetical protein